MDQSSPDTFRRTREELLSIRYLPDFEYLHLIDICHQSFKSSEIGPTLHVFGPSNFLKEGPKILDWHYKILPTSDHRAKFYADRPTALRDLALK